jgi:hypothetical protein
MANFPSFGNSQRSAPLFQKELFPNIEFQVDVSSPPNFPKTVNVRISIVNLKTDFVTSTLDRLFSYSLESANNELTTSSLPIETREIANIHFQIDISKATSLSLTTPTTPGGLSTSIYTTIRTANIDILIENLQVPSLESTFQRIKLYMTNAVFVDLNP